MRFLGGLMIWQHWAWGTFLPFDYTKLGSLGRQGPLCPCSLSVQRGTRPPKPSVILDTIEAQTKSMGALIIAGPGSCWARDPWSVTLNSAWSSFVVTCSGSNPFTDIRSLDSVPGLTPHHPIKGEQTSECFWPLTRLHRQPEDAMIQWMFRIPGCLIRGFLHTGMNQRGFIILLYTYH